MFWRTSEGAPKHGLFPELCRRRPLTPPSPARGRGGRGVRACAKTWPFPEPARRRRLSTVYFATVYFLNTAVNSTRQACQREISRTAAPSL